MSLQLENGNKGFLPNKAVGRVQWDDAKIWKALKKVNVQEILILIIFYLKKQPY